MIAKLPALLFACVALGACFKLDIPDAAQIRCSETAPRCPEGWDCCDGWCRRGCAPPACDGGATCGLTHAVDCQAGRICLGGCWAECPTCAALCADQTMVRCQTTVASETWLCRQRETCVVRQSDELIADCHAAPPQCQGERRADCDCLTGSYALYPPCAPQETCINSSSTCVICKLTPAQVDDGGPRSLDAMEGWDLVTTGADGPRPELDAGRLEDGGSAWGDASMAAQPDASHSDLPAPISWRSEPECFEVEGTGAAGASCCAVDPSMASYTAGLPACATNSVFPSYCDGYGSACLTGAALDCAAQDPCVWAWLEGEAIMCADYGPNVPCVAGEWQCVAGTMALSSCP